MSLVSSQHLEDSNDCSAKPRRVVGNKREEAAQLHPIPFPHQQGRTEISPRTTSGRHQLSGEDTLTMPCLTQLAPSDFSLRAATSGEKAGKSSSRLSGSL